MPKTYTVKEVADILGFSTNSIYTFLKEKRIKGVRVGKGRFRIPDEELSRILHLSKKSNVQIAPTEEELKNDQALAPSPLPLFVPIKQEGDAMFVLPNDNSTDDKHGGILSPNIFDWFVGLGAVVAGFGLFLFNSSYTTVEFSRMTLVYPIIRMVLIACGFGVLISSLFRQTAGWKRLFQLTLSVVGFINAYGLMRSSDIEGAALYGSLALIVAIVSVIPFGGIVAIGLYISIVSILFPIIILLFPTDAHIMAFATLSGVSTVVTGIIALMVAIILLLCFWVGYSGNRTLFLIATWLLTICDIVLAIWYAHLQFWSRSFFMMVTGMFTALLPYWWPLQQKLSRRYNLLLHLLFICVGGVMVMAVLVVYLLQQSIWMNRERELMNKVHLGHSRLANAALSVQSTLLVSANNADFVSAISDGDIATLNKYSKIIYESNPNIRRLVFLDKDGTGVALYPYGTFDEPNFAYRDYFLQPKNMGKPYISDVFQAKSDQAGRYVVVQAAPIYDAKNIFAGVVTASMDLDRLGLQLGQISAGAQGEYFVVADGKGVIVSHPNPKLIGTIVPKTDPLHRALQGQDGIEQGMLIEKISGMMAYADVPELRWAISLRIPTERVLSLTTVEIWIVFGVVSALMGVGVIVISYLRRRTLSDREAGP